MMPVKCDADLSQLVNLVSMKATFVLRQRTLELFTDVWE